MVAVDDKTSVKSEQALAGLQQILSKKSCGILPYLIPKLLVTPLLDSNIHALAGVAKVTDETIHYHFDKILSTLFDECAAAREAQDAGREAILKQTVSDIVLSIKDIGVRWLSVELTKLYCSHEAQIYRELACWTLAEFVSGTTADYSAQLTVFLKNLVQRFADSHEPTLLAVLNALKGLQKTTKLDEMIKHFDFLRNSMNSMVSDARHRKGGTGSKEYILPLLCLPKALEPFLPIYQHALMYGAPELRELSATGLGELVELTNPTILRPFLIKLTGPLIRIVGDRFPGHVKAAILSTLGIILNRGGVALKPFLPQLQTTFIKALNDPTGSVRLRGSIALGQLMALSTRIDPVVKELCDKITQTSGGIRISHLEALAAVLQTVGGKVSVYADVIPVLQQQVEDVDDEVRLVARKCLTSSLPSANPESIESLTQYIMVNATDCPSWTERYGRMAVLHELIQLREWTERHSSMVSDLIASTQSEDKIPIQMVRMECVGSLLSTGQANVADNLRELAKGLSVSNKDVCKTALKCIKAFAK